MLIQMSQTSDTLKIITHGALRAMTFGAYHHYTTNTIMELNNEKQNLQQKIFIEKMEKIYKTDMEELREKLNRIEQKKWWY